MGRFPKPCLTCGKLTTGKSYCVEHQEHIDNLDKLRLQEYKKNRPNLYDSAYRRKAKVVRETAISCHLCGGFYKPNDPFEADHVIAGDKDSPLLAAHRSCNLKRGNTPLGDYKAR